MCQYYATILLLALVNILNDLVRYTTLDNSTQLYAISKHHRRSLESLADTSFLGSEAVGTDCGLPLRRYLLEEEQSMDIKKPSFMSADDDSSSPTQKSWPLLVGAPSILLHRDPLTVESQSSGQKARGFGYHNDTYTRRRLI